MAQKTISRAPAAPSHAPEPQKTSRVCTMTYPVLGLLLALTFICGLLAGSLLTQEAPQTAQHQPPSRPSTGQQAQQATVSQPKPAISPQMASRISELEREVLQNPKNRAALVSLGHLYFDTHQHQFAIQAYENALALDGKDADVLTDLGVMYRAVGKFDKALECFTRAQSIEPGHVVAMFNQGVVLNFDLHKHEEAISVWQELVRLHPQATGPDGTPVSQLIKEISLQTSK